jgi:uncharacterized protein (TIGR02391 family)
MATVKKISSELLRSLCDIIGDTGTGLSGGDITRTLSDCGIADPSPSISKRHRLFEALNQRQEQDKSANHVVNYVLTVMQPVRYLTNKQLFTDRRARLNEVLSFIGLSIADDGTLRVTETAKTIDEAQSRAGRLKKKLTDRDVHHDVLRFCKAELLQENYFHAVFEATKSIADKIRDKTGLTLDGADLIDKAFGLGQTNIPLLALNTLQTDSEKSEHKGFSNLLKGTFGMFRNTTAHVPKIKWTINEEDALDNLTLASFLHRKLDKCVSTNFSNHSL